MLAVCLQKIGETEIKGIMRLNPIIKTLILCHLYKTISMDISSGDNSNNNTSVIEPLKTLGFGDLKA